MIRAFKHILVVTVAKVGSSNFLHSLKHKYPVIHHHSTKVLENTVNNSSNTLIIVGIRNPLDRALSYLFQTYPDDGYNDVKTSKDNYKGDYCFIATQNNFLKLTAKQIIESFFEKEYHTTFNNWFYDLFRITNIDKLSFDRDKGYQTYDLPNNNTLLLYTLEKLDENNEQLSKLLGIDHIIHSNNSANRVYNNIYKEVKSKIKFTDEYKSVLLDTDIMNFFYNTKDIENFRNMYT